MTSSDKPSGSSRDGEPKRLSDPETILFETSPYGSIDAIVEHDGRAVYFYLNGKGGASQARFGTRACWVRNLVPGPYVVNEDELKSGIPPVMPKTHCKNQASSEIPQTDDLSVVWFEEGNGAALIEHHDDGTSETLSVIPPWSGLENFHGYSSQCSAESPLAWPMPKKETLALRIQRAKEFWLSFDGDDPFSKVQPELLQYFDRRFDQSNNDSEIERTYFAIDGGEFPPRGMVQYQSPSELIFVTIAMSICPQPNVEIYTNDPSIWRRIELAIRLKGSFSSEEAIAIGNQVSHLASYPWRNFTWLGPGHSCPFGAAIPGHPFVLLAHDHQLAASDRDLPELPGFRGDPINLLWMLPITDEKRKQLESKTLTSEEIINATV